MTTDWAAPRKPALAFSDAGFAAAKVWFFDRWAGWAATRGLERPIDLSGSCKYGSLFMQAVFGGAVHGHFEHQYNLIDGRIVDLSHDAMDVGRMRNPYLHEPDYFRLEALQASLSGCQPRAERWAVEFIASRAGQPVS